MTRDHLFPMCGVTKCFLEPSMVVGFWYVCVCITTAPFSALEVVAPKQKAVPFTAGLADLIEGKLLTMSSNSFHPSSSSSAVCQNGVSLTALAFWSSKCWHLPCDFELQAFPESSINALHLWRNLQPW